MSKWSADDYDRRDARARIIAEYHPDDVNYLTARRAVNPRLDGKRGNNGGNN